MGLQCNVELGKLPTAPTSLPLGSVYPKTNTKLCGKKVLGLQGK